MADPLSPHVIGITLDTQGVAYSKVIVSNLTSGGIQIMATNATKQAVVDCANFSGGYSNGDTIGIENAGASIGGETLTVDTSGGMQLVTVDSAAAATTTNIGM